MSELKDDLVMEIDSADVEPDAVLNGGPHEKQQLATLENCTLELNSAVENDENENAEINDTSTEDLLGTETLLITGSESEADEHNDSIELLKVQGKALADKMQMQCQKLLTLTNKEESEAEHEAATSEDKGISKKSHETSEDDHAGAVESKTTKTKISNLIDSDSDAVETAILERTVNKSRKQNAIFDSDSDSEHDGLKKTEFGKKISKKIIDSDSEEEFSTEEKKVGKKIIDFDSDTEENAVEKSRNAESTKKEILKKQRISNLIDSDSEEEVAEPTKPKNKYTFLSDSDSSDSIKLQKKDKKKKSVKKRSNSRNSESDSDSSVKKSKPKKKISTLVDTDSESELESDKDAENLLPLEFNDEIEPTVGKSKGKKPMRASAKKALDEMQAIQSEQQRLHREAYVSVPYHKPKRHTLQEFLQRRTIIRPNLNGDGSPAAQILKSKSLKMNAEELEEYAKLMDDRAKEAAEFFKSESEDDDELELHDNEGVMDIDIAELPDKENVMDLDVSKLPEDRHKELEIENETAGERKEESKEASQLIEIGEEHIITARTADCNSEELTNFETEASENTENLITSSNEPSTSANIAITNTKDLNTALLREAKVDNFNASDIRNIKTEKFNAEILRKIKIENVNALQPLDDNTVDLNYDEPIAQEVLNNEETSLVNSEDFCTAQPTSSVSVSQSAPNEITNENLNNWENVENSMLTSQPIIMEVLELPKLDISGLHITPDKKAMPASNKISNRKLKQLIEEGLLNESPTLKGDPNMIIDLETGDLLAKPPSGVDNLFQRLLSTRKPSRPKASESLNILSTENGILEMTQVQVKVHETEDPNKEQKPGAAYFKLKENLKSIITKKRLEELKKKRDEEDEYIKCLHEGDETDYEEYEYEPETKPKKKRNKKQEKIYVDEDENIDEYVDDEADENDEEEEEEEESAFKTSGKKDEKSENGDEVGEICLDDKKDEVDGAAKGEDEEEDDDEESDDDDDDDDDDNDTNAEHNENSKRKNRIIKAFQDDSDDDEVHDMMKTQTQSKLLYNNNTLLNTTASSLFETQTNKNDSAMEEELLSLCSGNFTVTQTPNSQVAIISQMPMSQPYTGEDQEKEILELCSGTFNTSGDLSLEKTQEPQKEEVLIVEKEKSVEAEKSLNAVLITTTSPMKKIHKILSSDEEENARKTETNDVQRKKKLTKRLKKKKQKLGFSDDEESENDNIEEDLYATEEEDLVGEALEEAKEEEEEELTETIVQYDSEENEVVVKMTKNDYLKQFVEKEAVLSESEWGSADEDEKNMDKYDIELGDEDEFDRDKLQTELGQIHARKMLDQDIKEVRRIQELLFEDEETDGVGRQRQFRWKNAESGFSLEDTNREENDENNTHENSGDEENEHLWRKIRFEREQLLKEHGLKENSQDLSATALITGTSPTTSALATGTVKKINIIQTTKKTNVEVKKQTPFLISKNFSAVSAKKVRGSFLVRDKDTLTKLAYLTKGSSSGLNDESGTAGTVSIKSIKPQNFVFATLTEEEHVNMKRKTDDTLNGSNGIGINYMKKRKLEPTRDKCLIDRLL